MTEYNHIKWILEDLLIENGVVFNDISAEAACNFLTTHHYCYVIDPFKQKLLKQNTLEPKASIDFNEFIKLYKSERLSYPSLSNNLILFETTLKSILCNFIESKCFASEFDSPLDFFVNIANRLKLQSFPYKEDQITKIQDTINQLKSKLLNAVDFASYFVANVSMSQVVNIFHSLDPKEKNEVFKFIKIANINLSYPNVSHFDMALFDLIIIRNCIMHGSSLENTIQYYKFNTASEPRRQNNRESIKNLVNNILKTIKE